MNSDKGHPHRISRFEERAFNLLLIAFPRDFRERFSRGMQELFSTRLERIRQSGGIRRRIRFWLEIAGDVLASAAAERFEGWGLFPVMPLGLGTRRARADSKQSAAAEPNLTVGKRGTKMESIIQDVRQSVRHLAKSPGFTAVTVLVVALGIGANAAIFSVVDSLLFRAIPWEDPEEIVWIYQDSDDGEPSSNSYPAYLDMASHTDVFSGVTAIINGRTARYVADAEDSRQVSVSWVTSGYSSVLGLSAFRGR